MIIKIFLNPFPEGCGAPPLRFPVPKKKSTARSPKVCPTQASRRIQSWSIINRVQEILDQGSWVGNELFDDKKPPDHERINMAFSTDWRFPAIVIGILCITAKSEKVNLIVIVAPNRESGNGAYRKGLLLCIQNSTTVMVNHNGKWDVQGKHRPSIEFRLWKLVMTVRNRTTVSFLLANQESIGRIGIKLSLMEKSLYIVAGITWMSQIWRCLSIAFQFEWRQPYFQRSIDPRRSSANTRMAQVVG